jgi:hypothetical protein
LAPAIANIILLGLDVPVCSAAFGGMRYAKLG